MNFKTRQSYNNRLLFVYENGEVKPTKFVEVAFYGDNYILAKSSDNLFYTLLDLDGNETGELVYVVHRFQNGLLLTYNFFTKQYVSSDLCTYAINYNVYSVLNFVTGKSYAVNVIQSDNLLTGKKYDILQDKTRKLAVKDFLNKPIYCFRDFIFSEILDNQYMIAGSLLNVSTAAASFDFDLYRGKKIWSVVDLFTHKEHTAETHIDHVVSGATFKEAELQLLEMVNLPEEPFTEDYEDKAVYNDLVADYNMHAAWKKTNRLKQIFTNMLTFNHN
jgi:hypothetical protein